MNHYFSVYQISSIAGLNTKVSFIHYESKNLKAFEKTERCAHETTSAREKSHDNSRPKNKVSFIHYEKSEILLRD